jgi:hypothetical protein
MDLTNNPQKDKMVYNVFGFLNKVLVYVGLKWFFPEVCLN